MTSPSLSGVGIVLNEPHSLIPPPKTTAFDDILGSDPVLAAQAALKLEQGLKDQAGYGLTIFLSQAVIIEKAIQEENLSALELIMQHNLIAPAELQVACSKDKILECYAKVLSVSLQKPKLDVRLLKNLREAQVYDQALEKYPHLFNAKAVKKLFCENWIPSTMLTRWMNNPKVLSLFVRVLQEDFMSNDVESVLIKYFQQHSLLVSCFNQALSERNEVVIREMLDRVLIDISLLEEKLQNADTRLILNEHFKASCENVLRYNRVIYVLLKAGISYEEQDIWHVVKAGNYYLLRQFQARGADIASSIFSLVQAGQISILRNLLERQSPTGLIYQPPQAACGLDPNLRGLDPNFKNQAGKTLLIEAVEQDQQKIVELLLEWGANPLILSPDGRTVFQLAKSKSEGLRRLLYNPGQMLSTRRFDQGSSYSSGDLEPEEIVLKKNLERLCQGRSAAYYYGLFIRIKDVALVVLRSHSFFERTCQSYQQAYYRHRQNIVHCWACPNGNGRYPIPQELIPSHTTMHTVAFAIRQVQRSVKGEEIVSITVQGSPLPKKYICRQIGNTYKSENPSQEYGFKYAYEGIQIHGHGKNPEAARKAFLEHRDEVKKLSYSELKSNEAGGVISRWAAPPDLTQEIVSLQQLEKERQEMFKNEKDYQQKLDQLAKRVSAFLTKIESVVEARYLNGLSQTASEQEECQKMHQEITQELAYLPVYIRPTSRVKEWQTLIQRQIRGLNDLEKKLVEVESWDSAHVDNETKVMGHHLQDLLDLAVKHTVTSADQPTLKICFSSEIIPNIFVSTPESIVILKKAICRLIGANLIEIALPNQTSLLLKTLLQQQIFREKIVKQLQLEAQFFVTKNLIDDPAAMQELAGCLALFQDTSHVLEYLSPVPFAKGQSDRQSISNQTSHALLSSYASSRLILDRFWQIACFEESVLDAHLDEMMELLHQRLLLIDQENRQEEQDHYIYLHIDARDPKHLLDKQLFLLQTALLMALGQLTTTPQIDSTLTSIVELVQLRLKPNRYGNDKKKSSSFRFFIGSVMEELVKIRDIVGTACQSSSSMQTSFQTLKTLLVGYEFTDNKTLKDTMNKAFERLTLIAPFPTFDSALSSLIDLAGKVKEEIKAILDAYTEETVESEERIESLQMSLEKTSKVLDPDVSDSSPVFQSLLLLNAISQDQAPEKGDIEKVCLSESNQQVRSSMGRLQKILKERSKLKSDPKIEEDKKEAKLRENNTKFQQAIAALISSIQVYIEIKKRFSVSVLPYKENCLRILTQLQSNGLEKISQNLPRLIAMVKEEGTDDFEIALKLKGFVKERIIFLSGAKGKIHAAKYLTDLENLQKQINSWLEAQLPSLLQELLTSAEECQKIFYGEYIKQLSQADERLKLGIHAQTYYTAANANKTYYLWDGEKFSATPYHTANETHIPIPEIPLQATQN